MAGPDAHRDADGKPVLVGPDCKDCGLFHIAKYRCTVCDKRWEVMGHFRWSWQGKTHHHEPLDRTGVFMDFASHIRGHNNYGKDGMIVPVDK